MYVLAHEKKAIKNAFGVEINTSIETTRGVLACMAGISPDEDYIQEYKKNTTQLKPMMYYKPKKA